MSIRHEEVKIGLMQNRPCHVINSCHALRDLAGASAGKLYIGFFCDLRQILFPETHSKYNYLRFSGFIFPARALVVLEYTFSFER